MRRGIRIPDNEHFGSAALMLNGSNYHGSVYYIENYIPPPPFFRRSYFFSSYTRYICKSVKISTFLIILF